MHLSSPAIRPESHMPYSPLYAVISTLPQIAAAAFLPILGIALVSYLIKSTRRQPPQKSAALE